MILGLIFLSIGIAFYMLPFIIACGRHMSNRWSIFFLNLVFGWTLAGWVGALCWSVAGTAKIDCQQ